MSSFTALLTLLLSTILLTTLTNAAIQIVQPAPLATSLNLNPPPNLRWVYGDDDPPMVGILIKPVDNDGNPVSDGTYRQGTPTNWSAVTLSFNGVDIKAGMHITIAIVDPTNTDVVANMPVLDTVGPLFLQDGHTGIIPLANVTQGSAANVSTSSLDTSATLGSTLNGSITLPANDTIAHSTMAHSKTTSTDFFSSRTVTITHAPTGGASDVSSASATATTTTTSEAEKPFRATVTYLAALFLLAIPAFIAGINS